MVRETVPLTELQIDLMDVLWERDEATAAEVCEALSTTRGLALSTVSTLLTRLEKKGVVTHRKEGRQHIYRATVSRGDVLCPPGQTPAPWSWIPRV